MASGRLLLCALLLSALLRTPLAFTCVSENSLEECAALRDLYEAAGGEAWNHNAGWREAYRDEATDLCFFYGISCRNGYVNFLWLPNNRLNGTLPASLSRLTDLVTLCVPPLSALLAVYCA